MTVALALVVRDEADVIEQNLAFHLDHGVDLIFVVDHRSTDGTSDVLARLARTDRVHVTREDSEFIHQATWMTRLAYLAGRHGASWVLAGDADEFWLADGGSVSAALDALPAGIGCVSVLQRTLLPVNGSQAFHERLTVRLAAPAPIIDPGSPFKPVAKLALRPTPGLRITRGNHHAQGWMGEVLTRWPGLEILHVPLRTREQCAAKYAKAIEAWEYNPRGDLARAGMLGQLDRGGEIWDRVALDDALVAEGLAKGVLAADTRLRDAIQRLRTGARRSAQPVLAACDRAVLDETELTRLAKRLDDLGRSLADLERQRRRTRAVSAA